MFRLFCVEQAQLKRSFYSVTLILAMALLLSACSSPSQRAKLDGIPEARLYEQAQDYLKRGNYNLAIQYFRKLEANFPFGNYAESAQLSLIYAYYKSDEVELAEASANRFIRLHPNHNNVDYAYYLRGLSTFPEQATFFQSMFGTDLSKKSMVTSEQSFLQFAELAKRFPNSIYAEDAVKRMAYLRNLMARHELIIANHYLDYKAYAAAINRAQYVLENFQTSTAIPDALAILATGQLSLGLNQQADNSIATLKLNYPDYPALNDDGSLDTAYAKKRSRSIGRWLSFGLISNSKPPGFDTRAIYE